MTDKNSMRLNRPCALLLLLFIIYAPSMSWAEVGLPFSSTSGLFPQVGNDYVGSCPLKKDNSLESYISSQPVLTLAKDLQVKDCEKKESADEVCECANKIDYVLDSSDQDKFIEDLKGMAFLDGSLEKLDKRKKKIESLLKFFNKFEFVTPNSCKKLYEREVDKCSEPAYDRLVSELNKVDKNHDLLKSLKGKSSRLDKKRLLNNLMSPIKFTPKKGINISNNKGKYLGLIVSVISSEIKEVKKGKPLKIHPKNFQAIIKKYITEQKLDRAAKADMKKNIEKIFNSAVELTEVFNELGVVGTLKDKIEKSSGAPELVLDQFLETFFFKYVDKGYDDFANLCEDYQQLQNKVCSVADGSTEEVNDRELTRADLEKHGKVHENKMVYSTLSCRLAYYSSIGIKPVLKTNKYRLKRFFSQDHRSLKEDIEFVEANKVMFRTQHVMYEKKNLERNVIPNSQEQLTVEDYDTASKRFKDYIAKNREENVSLTQLAGIRQNFMLPQRKMMRPFSEEDKHRWSGNNKGNFSQPMPEMLMSNRIREVQVVGKGSGGFDKIMGGAEPPPAMPPLDPMMTNRPESLIGSDPDKGLIPNEGSEGEPDSSITGIVHGAMNSMFSGDNQSKGTIIAHYDPGENEGKENSSMFGSIRDFLSDDSEDESPQVNPRPTLRNDRVVSAPEPDETSVEERVITTSKSVRTTDVDDDLDSDTDFVSDLVLNKPSSKPNAVGGIPSGFSAPIHMGRGLGGPSTSPAENTEVKSISSSSNGRSENTKKDHFQNFNQTQKKPRSKRKNNQISSATKKELDQKIHSFQETHPTHALNTNIGKRLKYLWPSRKNVQEDKAKTKISKILGDSVVSDTAFKSEYVAPATVKYDTDNKDSNSSGRSTSSSSSAGSSFSGAVSGNAPKAPSSFSSSPSSEGQRRAAAPSHYSDKEDGQQATTPKHYVEGKKFEDLTDNDLLSISEDNVLIVIRSKKVNRVSVDYIEVYKIIDDGEGIIKELVSSTPVSRSKHTEENSEALKEYFKRKRDNQ